MKNHNDYFDSVTRCMMAFQYIEEGLKMVLIRLESLIYFRLKEFTPYNLKPKYSSIHNAAMGRLIDMLSVFCDDTDFIADLRRVKKRRDEIAHQGLLMTIDEMEDKDNIDNKATDLEQVNKDAQELLKKISKRWGDLDDILNKIAAEQAASADPGEAPGQQS